MCKLQNLSQICKVSLISVPDRQCTFDSPNERCHMCVRKGYDCGDKTRRGGAQDTVRISVLEQLALDNPTWTLNDAIAHLSGEDEHLRCTESSPESEFGDLSFLGYQPQCVDPSVVMDLGKTFEYEGSGLKMEFIVPGIFPPCRVNFRRAFGGV
jgi:hypothetical protein